MTLRAHLGSSLRRFWWRAKGWPSLWPPDWPPFRRFPHLCELCGRIENPLTDETFIAVHGEIIENPPGYDFCWGWFCKQLNLVRPTGHLVPHHRYVCHRHGRFMRRTLTDCLTGQTSTLLSQPSPAVVRLSNVLHEARYWSQAVARLGWFVVCETATALAHPVRYYKWVKFTYDSPTKEPKDAN